MLRQRCKPEQIVRNRPSRAWRTAKYRHHQPRGQQSHGDRAGLILRKHLSCEAVRASPACRSPHAPRHVPPDVQPPSFVWAAVCWRTTNSPESPTSRARTAVRKSSTLGRLLEMINLRTSRADYCIIIETRASLQPTSADATSAQRPPASGTAPMCALSSA